jgi:hypothetical protein
LLKEIPDLVIKRPQTVQLIIEEQKKVKEELEKRRQGLTDQINSDIMSMASWEPNYSFIAKHHKKYQECCQAEEGTHSDICADFGLQASLTQSQTN